MCTVALYWYSKNMKVLLSVGMALVLLVVALMYCPHRAIAGGNHPYMSLPCLRHCEVYQRLALSARRINRYGGDNLGTDTF